MYKGQIEGFPQEIVEAMLDEQVKQGNKRDVTVFERKPTTLKHKGGFDWSESKEGNNFWAKIIFKKQFEVFFDKYSEKTSEYPKVMLVSNNPITNDNPGNKRVVFAEKNGRYLAWNYAETLEDAEDVMNTCPWDYAKDIEEETIVELTLQDISNGKGVGVPSHLIKIKK